MSNVLEKFQMQGQVAIVTGGAGLLGKQFARTLAQAGAAVVVADLNRLTAHTIAETLVKDGYPSMGVGVDVTAPVSGGKWLRPPSMFTDGWMCWSTAPHSTLNLILKLSRAESRPAALRIIHWTNGGRHWT